MTRRVPARENLSVSQGKTLTVIPLGKEDFDAFEKALDNPPEPNEALRRLLAPDMVERVAHAVVRDVAELPGDDYAESEVMHVSADDLRLIVERNISDLADECNQLARALDLQIENENSLVEHNRALALEASHHAELVGALKRLLACSPPSAAADHAEQTLAKIGGASCAPRGRSRI